MEPAQLTPVPPCTPLEAARGQPKAEYLGRVRSDRVGSAGGDSVRETCGFQALRYPQCQDISPHAFVSDVEQNLIVIVISHHCHAKSHPDPLGVKAKHVRNALAWFCDFDTWEFFFCWVLPFC